MKLYPEWETFRATAYQKTQEYVPKTLGDWVIEKQTVSKEDAKFDALRAAFQGSRRHVSAGHYTGLKRRGHLVMSNTPDEIRDMLPLYDRATGRVLVNGLGLGCAVWGLLTLPNVTHIDVVEISTDVLQLVMPYFEHERVAFHNDDAFKIKWAKGTKWDAVWHDIWPDICTDDLQQHAKLKRRYARRTPWQKAWCEDLLRYNRSRGR